MRGKGLSVLRKCLPLLGLLVLSSPTARAQVVEYYHLDAVGNVRAITDVSGNVIERHEYLPFGEECTTSPCAPPAQSTNTRKFTGKERDPETGLDYFGARYYGSRIGRFTTVDPVYTWRDNLVDPQRWNRYAYARNNPLRYVDPDGRESMSVIYMSHDPSWGRNAPPLKQEAALWGGMVLAGLVSFGGLAAAELAPALLTEAQIAGGGYLVTRAEQIHGAVGGAVTQGKTTVAIAEVGAGRTLVASSEKALRPAQRALLKAGETAVSGPGHAEVTALNAAKAAGQTVTEVAASRPICANCAAAIREAGAKIGSTLKDKQN